MIKPQIIGIIGKKIQGILVSEHPKISPRQQIFLVFDDGTSYELYGTLNTSSGLDSGGATRALNYAEAFSGSKMTWYGEQSQIEAALPGARFKVSDVRM